MEPKVHDPNSNAWKLCFISLFVCLGLIATRWPVDVQSGWIIPIFATGAIAVAVPLAIATERFYDWLGVSQPVYGTDTKLDSLEIYDRHLQAKARHRADLRLVKR